MAGIMYRVADENYCYNYYYDEGGGDLVKQRFK